MLINGCDLEPGFAIRNHFGCLNSSKFHELIYVWNESVFFGLINYVNWKCEVNYES